MNSTTLNNPQPGAPAPLALLLQSIERSELAIREASRTKALELSRMAKLIDARLRMLHELRGEDDLPIPGIDDELVRDCISPSDRLAWVRFEDGHLLAQFEYGFRGELHDYEIRLPARYFSENPRTLIEADVAAARAREQKQTEINQAIEDQKAFETYQALKRKFEA